MKKSFSRKINNLKSKAIIKGLLTLFILILFTLFNASCGKTSPKEKAEEPAIKEELNSKSEVSVSKEQYAALKIQMGKIEQKNLSNILKSTGFLKVPPQSKANITSALGGTVQSILVQEGNHVKKGQTLLTLNNSDFIKMQEEYLDAKSQLTYIEAEYNRQKELSSKNVASQKTFQQVESNYNSLKVKINSLKQQLFLLGINTSKLTQENITAVINVVSPVEGSVSTINVNIGTHAEASKTLMDIVDNSHLHLDLFVFEQELPKIKAGQTIDFNLTNLPGKLYTAKIYSIGSAFENQTKTIPLHAEITGNKEGLIEGMNVTAGININNNYSPAVSSDAIASFGGNDYIFISFDPNGKEEVNGAKKIIPKNDKDKIESSKEHKGEAFGFKRIQIKKGISNGGYTEITPLEVLPTDTKVVINGAFYLMAMLTNVGEEE